MPKFRKFGLTESWFEDKFNFMTDKGNEERDFFL